MVENAKDMEKESKSAKGTGKVVDLFDGDTDSHTGIDVGAEKAIQSKEMSKDVTTRGAENDVPAGAPWTEVKEGTIAPIEKSGNPNTPVEDPDMTRFANQGTPDFQGDKADIASETLDTGKKVRGHKTKSGL